MPNFFDGMKWYEIVVFILALPFILAKETFQIWKEKRKK